MPKWTIAKSDFFAGKFKRYEKKHGAALKAVLLNLEKYVFTLNAGVKPALINGGFIHPEPQGVVAIDQKGAKGRPRQMRLYIYAIEVDHVLHLITIGDKNTQKRDLADCREFVDSLRKRG